jgi:hypothetical protein
MLDNFCSFDANMWETKSKPPNFANWRTEVLQMYDLIFQSICPGHLRGPEKTFSHSLQAHYNPYKDDECDIEF